MEITQQQQTELDRIGKKYDLRFVILHGSYATGKQHRGSDLDIAVLEMHPTESRSFLEMYGDFAQIFGDNRERELDLKTLRHTDPLFRYHVVRDGVLLYGNRLEYDEFTAYAFRVYIDSRDLRILEEKLLRKSIQQLKTHYA